MKRSGGVFGFAVAAALAFCLPSARAQVDVGGSDATNLIPFGTIGGTTAYTFPQYQQVYAATAFPGPILITSIAFQSSALSTTGAYSFDGTLGLAVDNTISPASPGTTYLATTNVFSGTQSATIAANGTFDLVFTLSSPFSYNPALGNLVLGVGINSVTSAGDVEFVSSFVSTDVGRTINSGPVEAFPDSGLLTRFGLGTAAVPEPSILSLLGALGMVGSAFALRRRHA